MDLFPIDLGKERYLRLLRRRAQMHRQRSLGSSPSASGDVGEVFFDAPKPRRGLLGRFWAGNLGLDADMEARAATVMGEARGAGLSISGTAVFVPVFLGFCFFPLLAAMLMVGSLRGGALLCLLWAGISAGMLFLHPRAVLHQLHGKPLTAGEIEALQGAARNRVERAYLTLVLDALRQPIPSPTAQADLRLALQALGDAVSGLPPEAFASEKEAGALRGEAAELREAAGREDDPIVADSLRRQADARERRAGLSGGEAAFSRRRAATLRREVREHIETLRAALPAFGAAEANAAGVAAVSQAVRRVAVDAASVAQARSELDEEILSAHIPAGAAPQKAPEQQVTSRQWWRG